MPPHCDAMDGPVAKAAMKALEAENVNLVLPFVHKEGEEEVTAAFQKVVQIRKEGGLAKEVAERYFLETVVRIHRAGEGAAFTGLKPVGLSEGPVIPVAEKALETGSPDELLELLCDTLRAQVRHKFDRVMHLKTHANRSVDEAREHVEAMLGLEVYSHKIYECTIAEPHEAHEAYHTHG